jgi:hypothetical protein
MNKSLEQRLIEKQPLTTPEIGMQQKPSNSKEIKIIITNYHFHFIITHATQITIFHHLVKKSSITNTVIAHINCN